MSPHELIYSILWSCILFVFIQPLLSSASSHFLHFPHCSLPAFISAPVSHLFPSPLILLFSFWHPLSLLLPLSAPSHHSFCSLLITLSGLPPSHPSFSVCPSHLSLSLCLKSFSIPLSETQLPPLFLYAWCILHARAPFLPLSFITCVLSAFLTDSHASDYKPFTLFQQNDAYLCNLLCCTIDAVLLLSRKLHIWLKNISLHALILNAFKKLCSAEVLGRICSCIFCIYLLLELQWPEQ